MLNIFNLDTENLKVFEFQKKIVVPIFEDLPVFTLQILMYTILDCREFLNKNF